jgi:hypothetical protein
MTSLASGSVFLACARKMRDEERTGKRFSGKHPTRVLF